MKTMPTSYTDMAEVLCKMYRDTMSHGQILSPRGQEIRELEDYQITVSPKFPFTPFVARNYNIKYFKQEMIWKLGANPYDESIKQHAKMWESVQNPDGTFNSNYGIYWFGDQQGLMTAYFELVRDRDSRRAVIPMLNASHMSPQTKDTVCTECVGFRIRGDQLNMSVHMRSSDQVFGLGTDIPTFSVLYWLMFGLLRAHYNLSPGPITITAMSSHIYSRHYDLINKILCNPAIDPTIPAMPSCKSAEAREIVASRGKPSRPFDGALAAWLFS